MPPPPRLPRPLSFLQPVLSLLHWQLFAGIAVVWFASYPPRQSWRALRAAAPYLCLAATWTLYYVNMAALLVYVYTSLGAQGAAVRAAYRLEKLSAASATSVASSSTSSAPAYSAPTSSNSDWDNPAGPAEPLSAEAVAAMALLAAQKALDALEAVTKLAARSAALTLAANVDVAIAVSDKPAAARTTWAAQTVLLYWAFKAAVAWAETGSTWGPVAKVPEMGRVASLVFAWATVGLAGARLTFEVVWHLGRNWATSVGWEPGMEDGEQEGEVREKAEESREQGEEKEEHVVKKKKEGNDHESKQGTEEKKERGEQETAQNSKQQEEAERSIEKAVVNVDEPAKNEITVKSEPSSESKPTFKSETSLSSKLSLKDEQTVMSEDSVLNPGTAE